MKNTTYITFYHIYQRYFAERKYIGHCFIVFLLSGISISMSGQILLNNPSFEDTPSDATTPMGWFECEEHTTPDIMPGYWGVYNEATEGETFVGMITRENSTFESIGQRTSETMEEGYCYKFTVDLAHSNSYSGYNEPIKLRIWMADKKCGVQQLVFESPMIEEEDWERFVIEFTAEKDYRYILLEAYYKDGWFKRKGNILIDNISPIMHCSRV